MNASRRSDITAGLLLALLTICAYSPAWRGGFVWDDDDHITENWTLRSGHGLQRIWTDPHSTPQYYPLVHTTFWIEYRLWGLNPVGYHVVNTVLHVLAAMLAWRALANLHVPGAWFAAALFAVHPVQVESVAWITERKNVLSGVFYFAALLAYLRFCGMTDSAEGHRRRWHHYALSLVLFLLALLSKTVTGSLPAAIALLLWWKGRKLGWSEIRFLLPMVLLAAAAGSLTAWLEAEHVGARGSEWDLSVVQRCLVAGRALCFYAARLLWPTNLTFIYPRWRIDVHDPALYFYPLAALGVVGLSWALRRRIGRGPLVALLCYAGTLLPALGFINIYPMLYSFVADHFQYHASISLLALLAALWTTAWQRLVVGPAGLPLRRLAGAALLLMLAGLTWRQANMYRDAETLWRMTLQRNPHAWMAHNNLGILLAERGQWTEAAAHFETALSQHPDDDVACFNLGRLYDRTGHADRARNFYEQALAINPGYVAAHCNLGLLLAELDEPQRALQHYRQALNLDPHHARTHNNLGLLYAAQGQVDAAIEQYRQALRARPDYATAHNNLAAALAGQDRIQEAIHHLYEVLRINPHSAVAHQNLAILLRRAGMIQKAETHEHKARQHATDTPPG